VIIDAHAHLGADEVFDEDFTEEELLESQARNGIQVTLVQPGTTASLTWPLATPVASAGSPTPTHTCRTGSTSARCAAALVNWASSA
jgi:hypothetical protein